MIKRLFAALLLGSLLIAAGCAKSAQPTPTAGAGTKSGTLKFESYVTQTSFSFPKSWEYEDEEQVKEGTTALFSFGGGRVAMQFLWMDAAQQQRNVFLQQLPMDDVTEQVYRADTYEGILASGVEDDMRVVAFEGSRPWYDTNLRLFWRVVMEADSDETYIRERPNLLNLLQSVTVATDANPAAITPDMLMRYDFKEDYGLLVTAPNNWSLRPDYNIETGYISLSFQAETGDNAYRVEMATVDKAQYDGMVDSLKRLGSDEDVYAYAYEYRGGIHTVTCMQEGKINRVRLTMQKDGSQIRYLWVSSTFRPVLDAAYYQNVIVTCIERIVWKKT